MPYLLISPFCFLWLISIPRLKPSPQSSRKSQKPSSLSIFVSLPSIHINLPPISPLHTAVFCTHCQSQMLAASNLRHKRGSDRPWRTPFFQNLVHHSASSGFFERQTLLNLRIFKFTEKKVNLN